MRERYAEKSMKKRVTESERERKSDRERAGESRRWTKHHTECCRRMFVKMERGSSERMGREMRKGRVKREDKKENEKSRLQPDGATGQ